MPPLPRQIRLAAGDYYMHGQDRRMRRYGLPGNVCRVALRLDKGLDTDLLRKNPFFYGISQQRTPRLTGD